MTLVWLGQAVAAAHEPAPEGACVFFGGSFWSSIWRVCMAHRVWADRILCFTHVNVGKTLLKTTRGRQREREGEYKLYMVTLSTWWQIICFAHCHYGFKLHGPLLGSRTAMGGFYQGKGGGKGAAAAAPAAAGGEELPGGLKRKLQALGYPVPWAHLGVCNAYASKSYKTGQKFLCWRKWIIRNGQRTIAFNQIAIIYSVYTWYDAHVCMFFTFAHSWIGSWLFLGNAVLKLLSSFRSCVKELGSVSLSGQAYMKVILWLEEDCKLSEDTTPLGPGNHKGMENWRKLVTLKVVKGKASHNCHSNSSIFDSWAKMSLDKTLEVTGCWPFIIISIAFILFEAPLPDSSTSTVAVDQRRRSASTKRSIAPPLRKFDKSWWEAVAKYAKEWLSGDISCELFIRGFIHPQVETEEKPKNFYIHCFPHLRWSFWIVWRFPC